MCCFILLNIQKDDVGIIVTGFGVQLDCLFGHGGGERGSKGGWGGKGGHAGLGGYGRMYAC